MNYRVPICFLFRLQLIQFPPSYLEIIFKELLYYRELYCLMELLFFFFALLHIGYSCKERKGEKEGMLLILHSIIARDHTSH